MTALKDLDAADRAELKQQARSEIEEEMKHENELWLEAHEKDLRTEIGPRIREEIETQYRVSWEV